jgi:hypothetical protein
MQGAAEVALDATSTFARPPEAQRTISTSFSASRSSGASTWWRSSKPRSYGAAMSAWPIVTLLRNNVQVATGVGGAASVGEHDSSAHVEDERERIGSVELVIGAAAIGRKVAAPFNACKRVSLSPHRRDLSTAAVR